MWTADRRVVGWFKKFEWESVYNELYSDDVQKQSHAIGRIQVWRSRVLHKLSASIDCTCSLVQAVIEDHHSIKNNQVVEQDVAIRMGYSMALIRFVNLITDKLQNRSFAQNVHRLADTLGLPDWMVDLRHEATHGSLPQLSVLRAGTQLALAWLKKEYWEAQNEWNEKEPVSSSESSAHVGSHEVEDLLVTYMQQQYQVMDEEGGKLTRRERTAMESTIDDLGRMLSLDSQRVKNCLLQDGYMIPSKNQLEALEIDEEGLMNSEALDLPQSLTKLWNPFLNKINSMQKTDPFVQELLKDAVGTRSLKARLLNGWVLAIIQAASHFESKTAQDNELTFTEPGFIDWQVLFDHCVEQPDVYNKKLLPCILKNLHPQLPEEKQNSIIKLTDLIVAEEEEEMETDEEDATIHRAEDLKTFSQMSTKDDSKNSKQLKRSHTCSLETSPWQLCTDPIDWSKYPLGECPGVTADYTNLELVREDYQQDDTDSDEDVSAVRDDKTRPKDFSQWNKQEMKNILEELDLL